MRRRPSRRDHETWTEPAIGPVNWNMDLRPGMDLRPEADLRLSRSDGPCAVWTPDLTWRPCSPAAFADHRLAHRRKAGRGISDPAQ